MRAVSAAWDHSCSTQSKFLASLMHTEVTSEAVCVCSSSFSFLFPYLITLHLERKLSFWCLPPAGVNAGCYMQHSRPFLFLYTDTKPTVETLGPTMKSEETTTPYPTDEETTECGENCSFEDGENWGVKVIFHPGWHKCQPAGTEAGLWLEQGFGGPLGQRSGRCWVLRGLGQWPFTTM